MLESINPEKFEAGTVFFKEGDPPGNVYLIQQGEVDIIKELGGSEKILKTVGWNDIFGEMALVDSRPRSATARAKTEVWCYEISRDMFETKLNEIDPFMQGVYRALTKLIRELTVQRLDH